VPRAQRRLRLSMSGGTALDIPGTGRRVPKVWTYRNPGLARPVIAARTCRGRHALSLRRWPPSLLATECLSQLGLGALEYTTLPVR
jgi:hypothetical protein